MEKPAKVLNDEFLINLIDIEVIRQARIKTINSIDTIQGYDLIFVIAYIVRSRLAGRLIIVNENNELSGMTFNKGLITNVDYPDQENNLSELIVMEGLLNQPQLQKITSQVPEKKIGEFLVTNKHITEKDLRRLLSRQASLRLSKYSQNSVLLVNFNRDKDNFDVDPLYNMGFYDIAQNWIFNLFKPEIFLKYMDFYSNRYFLVNPDIGDVIYLKNFEIIWSSYKNILSDGGIKFTYRELAESFKIQSSDVVKVLHFMVLTGLVLIDKNTVVPVLAKTEIAAVKVNEVKNEDLAKAKQFILNHKYFEALGVMNKYSALMMSNQLVGFYFIWIKLHGAFYNNYLLDLNKTEAELNKVETAVVGEANYYFVRSLLEAARKNKSDSQSYFKKAVISDPTFEQFPLIKSENPKVSDSKSIFTRIKQFISR